MPEVEDRFHRPAGTYQQAAEDCIRTALEEKRISQDDEQLVREFVTEISATQHISPQRSYKLYYILVGWRRFIGPYRENAASDVYRALQTIETAKNGNGKTFKKNTIADYTRFLKRFYLWMIENDYSAIELKKIQKISVSGYDTMTKTSSMLLSEDEIKQMLTTCLDNMDRAFLAMLYEGGFRVGELGKLKWHQVSFNEWNVSVNVNDKTGKPRYIPLVMSRPYLARWQNDYPMPVEPDGYVFLTGRCNQLQYNNVLNHLRDAATRAGIAKHITPHIFRHSRITHLKQQGYDADVIKLMMWGNITTNMFKTYAHLTSQDIDNEIAERQGIITHRKERAAKLVALQCPRCHTVNEPTASFCTKCEEALIPEVIDYKKAIDRKIEQLPEYKALIEKLQQIEYGDTS